MQKTAKILEIVKTREYDYENKHYYATTLKLDNGDEWECSKAKANFFQVWQSIEYIIEEWQYGKKIKLVQPAKQSKWTWQKEDPIEKFIGFAASYSKDLVESWKIELKDWESNADVFFNWMVKKHKDNKPVQEPQTQQTPPVAQTSTADLITPEQIKYARTLWTKTWLNDEAWKKYIIETYKVDSSKKLTKHQASEFIDYIKTIPVLPIEPEAPKQDDDLPF